MLRMSVKALSPALKIAAATVSTVASIGGIIGIYLTYYPLTNFNPHVVGRWNSDYSYPIAGGTLRFKGQTNLFHEGKYNVSGVITLEGKVRNQAYKYTYNVVGAGSWTADRERISITLQNLNSFAKSIEVAGMSFTPAEAEKISGTATPNLSESYPGGMSDEYDLQSITEGTVVLRATGPFGKPFTIQMHRQS